MQQVQDCLEFPIDTPSDEQLVQRFRELESLSDSTRPTGYTAPKKRNRKGNKQKRLERIERDA